jgi:hypothetical protein
MLAKKKLNDLFFYEKFLLYIIFLTIISLSSFIFCFLYINKFNYIVDSNLNIILKNIDFGYGDLIHNIYYNNNYIQKFEGVYFNLLRLPLLPIIISLLAKLTLNIYIIIILKNILFSSVFYFFIYRLFHDYNKNLITFILFIFIFLIIPQNFYVNLSFTFEEGIICWLVSSLFLVLQFKNNTKFIFISILIFLLYLTKSTMFFLCIFLPFFMIFLEKKNKLILLTFVFLLLSIFAWGIFGKIKTGRFPFGQSITTWNSWIINHALNKEFRNNFPYVSPDNITIKTAPKDIINEWEYFDFYNNENKKYLEENYYYYFSDLGIKMKFIFFNIHKENYKSNAYDDKLNFYKLHIISNIVNRIILISAIFLFFYNVKKNKFKLNKITQDLYYIFFITVIIIPSLIAWPTTKHLTPIFLISIIYLFFNYFKLTKKFY